MPWPGFVSRIKPVYRTRCSWPSKKLPRGDHAEVTPIPPTHKGRKIFACGGGGANLNWHYCVVLLSEPRSGARKRFARGVWARGGGGGGISPKIYFYFEELFNEFWEVSNGFKTKLVNIISGSRPNHLALLINTQNCQGKMALGIANNTPAILTGCKAC